MNLHQILTGATNDGNKCFAVGSIDCQHFTAYAAGCNIVILDGQFNRVQIISGAELGYTSELVCLSCCKDYGKIVASYGNKVRIFEPAPVIRVEGKKTLNYQWSQTSLITLEEDVMVLTWNCFGSRLLVSSGKTLQMWEESEAVGKSPGFFIGESDGNGVRPGEDEVLSNEWRLVWKTVLASPVTTMKFCSDGSLFATAGENDRLVKIWYENIQISRSGEEYSTFGCSEMPRDDSPSTSFSFVYVAHPRTVTGFSWRQTSRYIQRGILANMLLTSCKDAICRVWCETFLPDDGLLDSRPPDGSSHLPFVPGVSVGRGASRRNSHHQRSHKHRLVQRLSHIRRMLHKKKSRHERPLSPSFASSSSSSSAGAAADHPRDRTHHHHHHLHHGHHGHHLSDVAVELHFHLAATIDFGANIPTIGSFADGCCPTNFVTHWLNNKEFHTNLLMENLLEETWKKSAAEEDEDEEGTGRTDGSRDASEVEKDGAREDSWEDLTKEADDDASKRGHMQSIESDPSINDKHRRTQKLGKAKTFVGVDMERAHESDGGQGGLGFHSEANLRLDRKSHMETEGDLLEEQVDHMIKVWNETNDILFSIHPVDGSLLIWTVQYLDEVGPGMFRQAQAHFNSRLPRAFPAYDASTMLPSPWVYYESGSMAETHFMKEENADMSPSKASRCTDIPSCPALTPLPAVPPRIFLMSKHANGSLNLWDVCFTEESRFTNAVGVTHVARVCGHRYHTNSAICHPILPLLLTTSHVGEGEADDDDPYLDRTKDDSGVYCSELILWRVDPIGPLSGSGGINELARVSSGASSAFADVAWIPSLLPDRKTSPSSLFVASDGSSLRIYQAVFDARSLLESLQASMSKEAPLSPIGDEPCPIKPDDFKTAAAAAAAAPSNDTKYKIISHQSTSRPGCIIDLMPLEDTQRSWHQIQLMHVFQERMVLGRACRKEGSFDGAGRLDDLQERFYLVVLQRLSSQSGSGQQVSYGTVVFAWEVTVTCSGYDKRGKCEESDEEDLKDFSISTKKVCQQMLPIPQGVSVTSAAVAVGHLCSSSIYPACFSPYLVSTACSNGEVYFWNCKMEAAGDNPDSRNLVWKQWEMMSPANENSSSIQVGGQLLFVSCAYSGRVAVAYKVGGSVGAYRRQDYQSQQDYLRDLFSNLKVAIYQCEATGGSEWTLEDTIPLKTITLPDLKFDIDPHFLYDFDRFVHHHPTASSAAASHHHHHYPHAQQPSGHPSRPLLPSCASLHNLRRTLSTKSPKLLAKRARPFVFLDWMSAEDGTHVLTVGVGSQIVLYAPASLEMARAVEARDRLNDGGGSRTPAGITSASNRGKLQKSATLVAPNRAPQVIRWIKLRSIDLYTADGLAPFPVHISWVRSGILVVGMDNEMHVFSQWPDLDSPPPTGRLAANGDAAKEVAIMSRGVDGQSAVNGDSEAKEENNQKELLPRTQSLVSAMTKSMSTAWLVEAAFKDSKREAPEAVEGYSGQFKDSRADGSMPSQDEPPDEIATLSRVGLFEASRLASPTLPQYHPKQLLELLNFGKVRRVKAILWHLLRCVVDADDDESYDSDGSIKRNGGSAETDKVTEAGRFGRVSIAPLPLYALLSADESSSAVSAADAKQRADDQTLKVTTLSSLGHHTHSVEKNDYDTLFSLNFDSLPEENPFIDLDPDASAAKEQQQQLSRKAASGLGPSGTFGPTQAQLLSSYLTRSSLPGLTGLDQMYLLALAETVAHTKLDFREGSSQRSQDRMNGHLAPRAAPPSSSSPSPEPSLSEGGAAFAADAAVDDCGLRFLLAMRHHMHLINSLPMAQRIQLQKAGLSSSEFIWAFHSDSQEELLNSLPCMQKGNPNWAELKQFGVGWWLRNVTSLSRCMEKVAKATFQVSKDPLDSALFYLAMKKKNILWGLFRSVDNSRMAQFFKNNFSEDRWRRAALKNAYALIGLQKFQCAAAFFLLAGSVTGAVEVCLKNLNDIQLAMVVLRLYEGDLGENSPPSYKQLLLEKILGGSLGCPREGDNDEEGEPLKFSRSADPFLRSIAHWIFVDYIGALSTLLESAGSSSNDNDIDSLYLSPRQNDPHRPVPLETRGLGYAGSNLGKTVESMGVGSAEEPSGFSSPTTAVSSVFNFYVYIRTHPLILRQRSTTRNEGQSGPSVPECITPTERRLYFLTAHEHFKNGCPALALEVLMKLPPYITIPSDDDDDDSDGDGGTKDPASKDKRGAVPNGREEDKSKAADFDWSEPITSSSKVEDFDWSRPLSTGGRFDDEDDLKLDFGLDEGGDEDSDADAGAPRKEETEGSKESLTRIGLERRAIKRSDIMAQQLKFVACLKMIADELSTLASGYGVDGGQLRFHLYYWLEKEVHVLEKVCNYCQDETDNQSLSEGDGDEDSKDSDAAARRHAWLRTNHNLLVTLLNYTILHGSSGGGFASVRTEILLLLQEFQERCANRRGRPRQLPAQPSKVPLLNSNLSSSRTVVADLIQYLQNMCHDLLSTFSDMRNAPDSQYPQHKIYYIFSIGTALSSCMYQSLSDNDSFVVVDDKQNSAVGLDEFFTNYERRRSSYLAMGSAEGRTVLSSVVEPPKTEPSEWPGVDSLVLLMKQARDEDLPEMNVLLLESLISVYLSLLCYAMASYDAPVLRRLVSRSLDTDCWGIVFGGGVKQLVKMPLEGNQQPKHRTNLAVKTIGPQAFQQRFADATRSTYQDRFVPPKTNIIDYLLSKPSQEAVDRRPRAEGDSGSSRGSDDEEEDYDDGSELDYGDNFASEDVDDFKTSYGSKSKKESRKADNTHLDPRSFPWQLMRYAIVRHVNSNLSAFLPAVGFNVSDLAHRSAKLDAVVKNLSRWEAHLKEELDANPGSLNVPGLYAEPTSMFAPVTAQKYSCLTDPRNAPFPSKHRNARPVRKLWQALVCKEQLREVFIRYAFKGKDERKQAPRLPEIEPMKIIHKDQEVVTSFALNQTGLPTTIHHLDGAVTMHLNCVAMATHKEIIEVDMSQVVEPPDWLGHDVDYDVELIQNPMQHGDKPEDFLLLRSPHDSKIMNGALGPFSPEGARGSAGATTVIKGISIPGITSPGIFCYIVDRSRRLMRRILKRPDGGVRRLASHPLLPFYVSGADDGCVKLWEWGQPGMVSEVRKSGAFPKVTMVAFNEHGNKVGISDVEGSLCLWQVGAGTLINKPYLSMKCHNKTMNCFTFLGCSSLLCTSGQSSDGRNVALWDTLLPQRKMLVQSFPCHPDGSPSVAYAPSHQTIISGGKKGEICIFDVRQRQLRHTFQAHGSAIKCLAVDPSEEFFVSGAADGDIKVWSLSVHGLLHSFTAEHARASSNPFRNVTSGVIQVTLNADGHLFSCGNDGTLKIRRLEHPRGDIFRACPPMAVPGNKFTSNNNRVSSDNFQASRIFQVHSRDEVVQTWKKVTAL